MLKMDGDNYKKLKHEWVTLAKYNKSLCYLAQGLADFSEKVCKKDMIITAIYRTEEKQAEIYRNEIKLGKLKKAPATAHSVWAAIDFRTKHLNIKQINECANFLKEHFDRSNNYKRIMGGSEYQKSCTVIYHEIPSWGPHFHVNYTGPVVLIGSNKDKHYAMKCHDSSGPDAGELGIA